MCVCVGSPGTKGNNSTSRGAEGTCKALPNEALCKHPRKHGLITRVYLLLHFHFIY